MAGEVAIKQMNFLPVTLFQTLPILVSGEAIKKVQPPVQRTAADLRLGAVIQASISTEQRKKQGHSALSCCSPTSYASV